MRKFLLAATAATVVLGGVGCAHPQNEVPLPGESVTSTSKAPTSTATSSGRDETASVCSEAKRVSNAAVSTIQAKLSAAQTAQTSNPAAALAAVNEAKAAAKDWSATLSTLAAKQIKPSVKTVLTDGITMINGLANASPTSVNPAEAENKVNDFLTKLNSACA